MRNEFAHEVAGSKLSDGSHKDRIRELIQPLKKSQKYNKFDQVRKELEKQYDDVHVDFYIVTAAIIILLEALCEIVKPVNVDYLIKYST